MQFNCSTSLAGCIREFQDLSVYDATKIIMEYYSYSGTFKDLGPYVESDAKRNFTTNLEMIRRIIRKHYGLPEFPGRTLYPEK